MTPVDYDVAIVGLGPTGATLAHLLGQRGLSVVVLEREPRFYGNARAVYTDDECMRVFQSAQVADELALDMQVDTMIQLVRPDGRPLMEYLSLDRSNGWPVTNFLYQPALEQRLVALLDRYPNVEIRRGREVVSFRQDDEGVDVVHQATQSFRFDDASDARRTGDGDLDPQTVRARYLVGADGGRSAVREALGIGMDGRSFPQPWLVVDLEMKPGADGLKHLPYFQFVCDAALPTVNCPQPGPHHRFEFMMMPGQTAAELVEPAMVRALISKYVDPDQVEVRRKLVYTFNALIAQRWRDRRILLAGDAAHMTPQFIGQGMSSGIRDAANLAWKLDAVLRGIAGEGLLDTYQTERYPHALAMIRTSELLKDVVSVSNPAVAFARNAILAVLTRTPRVKTMVRNLAIKPKPRYKAGRYFGLARRRPGAGAGTLMPQPVVRKDDGKTARLDDLLGGGFALVGLGTDPREGLSPSEHERLASLGARFVVVYALGGRPRSWAPGSAAPTNDLIEVEEIGNDLSRWFRRAGFPRRAIAVLRPDRFAFAVVPAGQLSPALSALELQLATGSDRLDETVGQSRSPERAVA